MRILQILGPQGHLIVQILWSCKFPGLLGKTFSTWVGNLVNSKKVRLSTLAHWIALELLQWYALLHTPFFIPTNHPAGGKESSPFTMCVCTYIYVHT